MSYIYEYQFRFFLPLFLKIIENSDYCTYLFSSCYYTINIILFFLYQRHESLNYTINIYKNNY